jgi:hypothetical protein
MLALRRETQMTFAIVFVMLIAAVVALCHFYAADHAGEWRTHELYRRKKMINGTFASGTVMRRKVNGKWEYRHATDDELMDDWLYRQI